MILKCIRTVAMAALAMVSINVSGQDLLARQAPIDRKLKAVDSLALIRQIKAEQAVYPAYSLYPNWNNDRVHAYGGNVQVPDSFRIDLTGFCMPTTHTKITSKCGPRWRRMHNGLDIKVYIGDTIRAAFDGRVRMVKYERRGYGKYVVIRHDNGLETIYGHLSKQIVAEDEYVKAGDPIGLGGNTGRSTGSHLHFETRFLGEVINPEFMFDFPNQDIVSDSYLFVRGSQVRHYGHNNGVLCKFSVFFQEISANRHDLISIYQLSVFIYSKHTIRISVKCNTDICLFGNNSCTQFVHMGRTAIGINRS